MIRTIVSALVLSLALVAPAIGGTKPILQIDPTCDGAIIRVVDPSIKPTRITIVHGKNLVTGPPGEPIGNPHGEFFVRAIDRRAVATGTVRIETTKGTSIEHSFAIAPEVIGIPARIDLGDVVAGERTTFTIRIDTPDSARATRLAWYASSNSSMSFDPISVELKPKTPTFCAVTFTPKPGAGLDTASVRTWCGTIRQFEVAYTGRSTAEGREGMMTIVPHPVRSGATVELQLPVEISGAFHAEVVDLGGRRIGSVYDGSAPAPTHSIRVPIPHNMNCPSTYVMRLTVGDRTFSHTFMCAD